MRRGFVMVLAIFFLAVMEILAIAMVATSTQEIRGNGRYAQEIGAWYAADAGVQDCLAYMEAELGAGREPTPTASLQRTGRLGEFVWNCTITPDPQTFPNGHSSPRVYTLLAAANATGSGVTRVLRTVVSQRPMTYYARFMNHWPDPQIETVYFYGGRIFVDGPVHSNEHLWVYADSELYGYAPSSDPLARLFFDGASCVDGARYPATAPSTDAERRSVYNTTRASRCPKITGPVQVPDLSYLPQQAWGGSPGASPGQVYFQHSGATWTGGIYVAGDVESFLFSTAGSSHTTTQTFRVGGQTYEVAQDWDANLTHYRRPGGGGNTTVTGMPSCFYAEGSILNLRGDYYGNYTLGVNSDAQKDIVVGGSIQRSAAKQGSLGLVGYHLRFPPESVLPRTPINLYAAVFMAGGDGYGGAVSDDWHTGGLGVCYLRGSLIEGLKRPLADTSAGTGWNLQVRFDSSLRTAPPPQFPSLNRFTVRATYDES